MADLANSTVNTPCLAYKKMAIHRELIDDLLGGTLSMRKAGTKWLPKETKEEQGSYENRLKRSTLFNAYKDTTDSLSGKPFSKAVDLKSKDNLPDGLAEIADNCDMQGTNLTQFAKEIFDTLLNRGLTHILTDYPKTFSADGKELTIAEENAAGVRPYFVHIKPEQLIGWRYEITSNGKFRLTQIRWKTSVIEADGPYGEKAVEEIRVMTPTTIEVHRQNDKGDFVVASTGEHTFGEIPLTTCYINKKGFMVAEPPLEGLAWLNLDHWQSSSDQKNLLRFARCPIAFISGLSKQEVDENFVFAAGSIFSSTNADADAKYLEHTGAAIGAGRTDILDIEERMIILGLEPLLSKTGNQTATGQSIDTANTQCAIQAWIQALEMALLNAYKLAAQWIGVDLIILGFRLELRLTSWH